MIKLWQPNIETEIIWNPEILARITVRWQYEGWNEVVKIEWYVEG